MVAVAKSETPVTKEASVPPLGRLYFYLTSGCNLACRHCWLAPRFGGKGDPGKTLPVDLFEEILREAKPLGLVNVKLTGGEPLIHPEISRILEIVRREDLALTMETNGVECTPALVAEIARNPKRFVSVSLDGTDAETHEWVRGVPGSFEKAKGAVRMLGEAGLRPQVIFTVLRANEHQVDGIVGLAGIFFLSQAPLDKIEPVSGTGQATALLVENSDQVGHPMRLVEGLEAVRGHRLERFETSAALARAVPIFFLHLSLTGKFWKDVEAVLGLAGEERHERERRD